MTTLPACFYAIMPIDQGMLCVEAADEQGMWKKNMPTVGDWMRGNWYIFLVLGIIVALSVIGIVLSVVRWCRRIQHRHNREERNKRVDGMLRLVSASFHGTLSRKASSVSTRHTATSDGHAKDAEEGESVQTDASSRATSPRGFASEGEDEEGMRYNHNNNNNNNNNRSSNNFNSGGGGYSGRDGEGDGDDGNARFESAPRRRPSFAPPAAVARPSVPSSAPAAKAQPQKRGRRPKKAPA